MSVASKEHLLLFQLKIILYTLIDSQVIPQSLLSLLIQLKENSSMEAAVDGILSVALTNIEKANLRFPLLIHSVRRAMTGTRA